MTNNQTITASTPLARALTAYRLDPVTGEAAQVVAAMCERYTATFTRTKLEDGRIRVRLEMVNGDSLGGTGATTDEAIAHLHARTEELPNA